MITIIAYDKHSLFKIATKTFQISFFKCHKLSLYFAIQVAKMLNFTAKYVEFLIYRGDYLSNVTFIIINWYQLEMKYTLKKRKKRKTSLGFYIDIRYNIKHKPYVGHLVIITDITFQSFHLR